MATAFSTRMTSCKLLISRQILTEDFDDDLMRIFMPRSPGQLIPKTDRKRRPVFVCLFENFYRTKWMNVLFSLWWKMCWYKYILYIFVCIIVFSKSFDLYLANICLSENNDLQIFFSDYNLVCLREKKVWRAFVMHNISTKKIFPALLWIF